MSTSIFSTEVGSKLSPNLPEPAPKPEAAPALDSWHGFSWAHRDTASASADVNDLDKREGPVVTAPDPYTGPVKVNDGKLNPVLVPVNPAGCVSRQEVKLGRAGLVRMPSGAVISAGGELLKLALRNGGKLFSETER